MKRTQDYNDILFFFLKLTAIWLSWKGISFVLGEENHSLDERMFPSLSAVWEELNNHVRILVLNGAEILLNLFGLKTENTGYILRIVGSGGVSLGNYCLGLQLMYYFIMLLIISNGSWKLKLLGSVAGIIITNLLNIFRIASFNLVLVYSPLLVPAMHDYIFNAVVLGCLFLFYFYLLNLNYEKNTIS